MRNIHLTIIFLIATVSLSLNANAQNADEIIAKHLEARGGQAAWEKVESIKYTGTFTGFSIPKPFTTIQKRPNLYRSDFGLSKFDVTIANDGTEGWTIDPWFDIPFARLLNNSEQQVTDQKAEFGSPFFNYKEKGYEVNYLGMVQTDGIQVHKLELRKPQQAKETWYLDANNYLEFKLESLWDDFGFPLMQETYYDDFRTVQGIIIPFYTERAYGIRNRITEIVSVEINPNIHDDYFNFPISTALEKLHITKGPWTLRVEAPSRTGIAPIDSVTCEIIRSGNKLTTQVDYNNYFRFVKDMDWTYHANSEKYRLNIYNQFDGNMELYEGALINDTIRFHSIKPSENKNLYQWIKVSKNNFILESKMVSEENPEGQLQERFVFTKNSIN